MFQAGNDGAPGGSYALREMRARARWVLLLALSAPAAYGCGTLLAISPDEVPDAAVEAGDAPAVETGADGSVDASDDTTCVATSCTALQANCGAAPDGCGQTLADCGVCSGGETCGAAGPNRCGDGGCDAATACKPGQCGPISNGCGGTVECPGCSGHEYCNAGTCKACGLFASGCASTTLNACPKSGIAGMNLYACPQLATTSGCLYCPNPTTGKGSLYCCP